MIFKTLTGSSKRVSKAKKYLIQWNSSSRSKMQFNVKQYLKKYWLNDIVFEEFPIAGTKMTFDFYNPNKKVAIEVQGNQHLKYTPFFHGKSKSNFLSQIRRDNDKQKFCELNSIKLVEIYPNDEMSTDLFKSFGVIL
jgi:very-short-patch-repair endonuclease